MAHQKPARELTPLDLRSLEPDLLGALGFILYGWAPPPLGAVSERRSFAPNRKTDGDRGVAPR
jgi:hypothetical protein